MSTPYAEFRRKLDAVLRQRDPQALRAFLIAEGQWEDSTATDPERAMWMMIATSPALAAQRDEAIGWLADHGYAEEAHALGGKGGGAKDGARQQSRPPALSERRSPTSGHPPRRPPDHTGPRHPRRP